MPFSQPITDVIQARFSCRSYQKAPIAPPVQASLEAFIGAHPSGPFGTQPRFKLVAATADDRRTLRGLGTYGFIRGAQGFIIGAAGEERGSLEDYGYLMEHIILLATDLGLGSCWLGGSFTRSSFAKKIALQEGEQVPAVTSLGYVLGAPSRVDALIRQSARADRRRPWEQLFFDRAFDIPLSRQAAGDHATPLEMVRLGPSASNKQPWRIVKDGVTWHLYLRRTPRYQERWVMRLLSIADMQRIDMGIAMCHWALTAAEIGLPGRWSFQEPAIETPDETVSYVASWVS